LTVELVLSVSTHMRCRTPLSIVSGTRGVATHGLPQIRTCAIDTSGLRFGANGAIWTVVIAKLLELFILVILLRKTRVLQLRLDFALTIIVIKSAVLSQHLSSMNGFWMHR